MYSWKKRKKNMASFSHHVARLKILAFVTGNYLHPLKKTRKFTQCVKNMERWHLKFSHSALICIINEFHNV